MKNYDLIIVGGGVLGAFHAFHALNLGLKVALFERNTAPQGATVRNFGQIVPSGFNSKWQQFGRRSLDIYKNIQSEFDISARQNGSIYLASDDEEMVLLEELSKINRANDYPSQMLSAAECLKKYPSLRENYVRCGLFFPEEITLEPRTAIHRILRYLVENQGLDYFPDTQIEDVSLGSFSCNVVASDGRKFRAEKVVVCSGSDFRTLFPDIFAASDLTVVKIQMLETVPQPTQKIAGSILTGLSIRRYESFAECPSWPVVKKREAADSFEKQWGVHILFKQTTSGSVILGDSHEYAGVKNADDLNFDLNFEVNDFMIERAREIFDLENWQIQRAWAGIYSQCKTQDIFLYEIENRIHIVTGIGGKGMTGSAGFAEENIKKIFTK